MSPKFHLYPLVCFWHVMCASFVSLMDRAMLGVAIFLPDV